MVSKLLPGSHRRQTAGIITLSAHAWSLSSTKQNLIPASIYTVSRPSFLSTLNIRFNDELMIYCVNSERSDTIRLKNIQRNGDHHLIELKHLAIKLTFLSHFFLARERDTVTVIGRWSRDVTRPACCVTEERDRETATALPLSLIWNNAFCKCCNDAAQSKR